MHWDKLDIFGSRVVIYPNFDVYVADI